MGMNLGKFQKLVIKPNWEKDIYPQLNERQRLGVNLKAMGARDAFILEKLGMKQKGKSGLSQLDLWFQKKWFKLALQERREAILHSKAEALSGAVPYAIEIIFDALERKDVKVSQDVIDRYFDALQAEGRKEPEPVKSEWGGKG